MKHLALAFVLLAGPALAQDHIDYPPAPPAIDVDVIGGGTVVLGTTGPSHVEPLAAVAVHWRMAGRERSLDALVEGDFTGLPDAQISLADASEFRALEMSLGLHYKAIPALASSGYCEGGFASRIENGAKQPATSAPLWASCGLSFRDNGDHRGRLRVGLGPDERLGWGWTFAAHVKGSLKLGAIGSGKVGTSLLVRAILGLETPVGQSQRVNLITAGVGLSWGK